MMTRFLKEVHHLWVFVGVASRSGEPDCYGGNQREKLSCDEAHRSNENKMSCCEPERVWLWVDGLNLCKAG